MASVALHKRKVLGAYRGVLCALRNHVMPSAYTGDVWVNAVSAEFRRHKHVTDAKERDRLIKTATDYKEMLNATADHQRLLLKYGWGVARSQRDEIERMVSRVGLRTPVPPEYMEYHEKQQRAEVDAVREARDAALSEGGLPVSAHVSEAAVHSAIRVEASASTSAGLSATAAAAVAGSSIAMHARQTAAAAATDAEIRQLFRAAKPAAAATAAEPKK